MRLPFAYMQINFRNYFSRPEVLNGTASDSRATWAAPPVVAALAAKAHPSFPPRLQLLPRRDCNADAMCNCNRSPRNAENPEMRGSFVDVFTPLTFDVAPRKTSLPNSHTDRFSHAQFHVSHCKSLARCALKRLPYTFHIFSQHFHGFFVHEIREN